MAKKHPSLYNRALNLEYLSIGWNILEGVVCVIAGIMSGSVSLFAYGLEAGIEIFASCVVVWELKGSKGQEKKAIRLIGAAYILVCIYIFSDATHSLFLHMHPSRSYIGIVILLITCMAMSILGIMKYSVGNTLASPVVLADAKFTLIDALLSVAVLIGLFANALFGWWWMDQLIALLLSGVALREGLVGLTS